MPVAPSCAVSRHRLALRPQKPDDPGGATWNGSLIRDQVRYGSDIIARLTPAVIHLMMVWHGVLCEGDVSGCGVRLGPADAVYP